MPVICATTSFRLSTCCMLTRACRRRSRRRAAPRRPASASDAGSGHIGVGKLVDEREPRLAGDDGVEVHLLEHRPRYENDCRGMTWRPASSASVSAGRASRRRRPRRLRRRLRGARGLQHCVGLAHARRGAEEDAQLAAASLRLLVLHPPKKFVGIWTIVGHAVQAKRVTSPRRARGSGPARGPAARRTSRVCGDRR